MRVPDIASSAGYAVTFSAACNYDRRQSASLTLSEYEQLNRNANFVQLNEETQSHPEYLSAADEFIQKALSSSLSGAAQQRLRSPNQNHTLSATCKEQVRAEHETSTDPSEKVDRYNDNSYRSFKDSLNPNSTLYREYGDELQLMNSEVHHYDPTTTDISAAASLSTGNDDLEQYRCEEYKDNLKQFCSGEWDSASTACKPTHSADLFNDNDYENQSMRDLSNDNRDNDVISPALSSDSVRTSYCSYFPRGIINPNYPGFQHLAHTLTEHFDTTIFSDSCDSEMSEYEMDVSADSCDDISEENVQPAKLTNCNNNNEKVQSPAGTELFPTGVAGSTEMRHDETGNDANCNMTQNNIINYLPGNLETILSFLEPDDDATLNVEHLPADTRAKQKPNQSCVYGIPPDILIENRQLNLEIAAKKENRPDLLRGVSPQLVRNAKSNDLIDITVVDGVKEEVPLGMTPVDIIGDFGQEVEREFGLLVTGYRRLVDGTDDDNERKTINNCNKVADAVLSKSSDKIDSNKYLATFEQITKEHTDLKSSILPSFEDNNAVDWSCSAGEQEYATLDADKYTNDIGNANMGAISQQPKYQKPSYDDRQLPPVAIDYKRCQQSLRTARKIQCVEKNGKATNLKVSKPNLVHRLLNKKRNNARGLGLKVDKVDMRKREEEEIHQYQQLISDKELILCNSKYTKMSSWAQYIKNSVKDRRCEGKSTDLISPSALDLFDAYKIGTEIDMETLQKHFKMAKEIEKKRRNDREEIRRRLAMGAEENCNDSNAKDIFRPNLQANRAHNDNSFGLGSDTYSDTESHSSDSETCPKLSKMKYPNKLDFFGISTVDKPAVGSSNNIKEDTIQREKEVLMPHASNEDKECDFFTKQARLQIEARMALAQAKGMAHMQMEIERQKQRLSPITGIIRGSLEKVGVQITTDKRRVSRLMLTEMNIAQLQILVNSLHTHIEDLNETLVHFLMERDDLHMGQDSMLVDIEELTRYIGAQEHLATKNRKDLSNKPSK